MVTMKLDGLTAVPKIVFGVDATAPFKYLALSENTGAESSAGTTLTGEIVTDGLERALATPTYVADYIGRLTYTWTAAAVFSVRKIAAFNAAVAGNMLFEHLTTVAKGVEIGETLTGIVSTLFSDESP